ncbi:hypothetical protein A2Z67_06270 [Candidatus Woesebacteria bacterium RBG_13_36_22]|uniref:Uncharacterized protein n=1 Tax=Candidatus Woesebacteria bacterium RBG_13_36_22 TaxID=1802478 RepID=A0A1F7WZA5_9BACT|nr:MAG: hypothetical protein A2Z67_06270 [Candidatus Woesebacteria bacterium RBG_13_36_22]
MSEDLGNPSNASINEAQIKEPARTIEFWRKQFTGLNKKIFDMIVYEQCLEERDRLTKSQLDFYMDNRKRKKIS